jgi:hypothetical protein
MKSCLLPVCVGMVLFACWQCSPAAEKKGGAAGREVTLSIQGVLASKGADPGNPEIDPSLAPYRELLQRLGFGKYENIGRGSGRARAEQTLTLKVGSHTVELQVASFVKDSTRVSYVVKDSQGRAVGSNALDLRPGRPVPVMLGDPTVPVVLLFEAGRPGGK